MDDAASDEWMEREREEDGMEMKCREKRDSRVSSETKMEKGKKVFFIAF